MSIYEDDDALSGALASRHIPHSRSSRKGGKGGKQQAFDPLATIGTYEILCKADGVQKSIASWITIHSLTDDESGLVASFAIGKTIEAMGILAGSRKVLGRIVDELETEHNQEDDEGCENEHGSTSGDEIDHASDEDPEEKRDHMRNRRAEAFEKNSFRNPKFWLCWRGRVRKSDEGACIAEKNMGYLIWKSNQCEQFEGTISCDALGWNNVKIKGHRIRKGAAECHLDWTDVQLHGQT